MRSDGRDHREGEALGAADAAIEQWLDCVDPAFGMTPRNLIADGRTADVLDTLDRMDAGVFG